MDPARADFVRPEFVEAVRKLQPVDVRILGVVQKTLADSSTMMQVDRIAEQTKLRPSAAEVSVSHLEALNLVRKTTGSHLIALTDHAKELMVAVAP
jgi:RIO-like serine/threonine protein kinase